MIITYTKSEYKDGQIDHKFTSSEVIEFLQYKLNNRGVINEIEVLSPSGKKLPFIFQGYCFSGFRYYNNEKKLSIFLNY